MNRQRILVGALVAAGLATAAYAATPAETVAKRQANFKTIGRSFKAINDEVRKPTPDVRAIQANATTLHKSMSAAAALFPKGSGAEAGVKTAAKPDIWANWPAFTAAHLKGYNATNALNKAAGTGNIDAIRAAMPAVGAACKSCHDKYKKKDD